MRYAQRLVSAVVYIHGFSLCCSRPLFFISLSGTLAFSGPRGA
jgi:hypothetical protein